MNSKRKREEEEEYKEEEEENGDYDEYESNASVFSIIDEIDKIEHNACSRVREQLRTIDESQTVSPQNKKLQKLVLIVTLCAHALRHADARGVVDFDNVDMLFDDATHSFQYDSTMSMGAEGYWYSESSIVIPIKARYSKDEGVTFVEKPMVVKLVMFYTKYKNSKNIQAQIGFKGFLNETRILKEIEKRNTTNSNFHSCTVLDYGFLKFNEHLTIGVNIMSRLRGRPISSYYVRTEQSDENIDAVLDNLVSAIDTMHKMDLVHNDLRSQNIYLDESTQMVQILDFGLSFFVCEYEDSEKLEELQSQGIRVFGYNSCDIKELFIDFLKLRDYLFVFREQSDQNKLKFLKNRNFHRGVGKICSKIFQIYDVLQNETGDISNLRRNFKNIYEVVKTSKKNVNNMYNIMMEKIIEHDNLLTPHDDDPEDIDEMIQIITSHVDEFFFDLTYVHCHLEVYFDKIDDYYKENE